MITGEWGEKRSTVGTSRPLDLEASDPRTVVASVLAKRDGWAEIRPGHWAGAGAVVAALKTAGMLRTARERKAAKTATAVS